MSRDSVFRGISGKLIEDCFPSGPCSGPRSFVEWWPGGRTAGQGGHRPTTPAADHLLCPPSFWGRCPFSALLHRCPQAPRRPGPLQTDSAWLLPSWVVGAGGGGRSIILDHQGAWGTGPVGFKELFVLSACATLRLASRVPFLLFLETGPRPRTFFKELSCDCTV